MATFKISAVWTKGLKHIDFDTKVLKKELRIMGGEVRKEARRLISKRAVSKAGENPGRDSGELRRSVNYRVSRSGFSVAIKPYQTKQMKDYYPAFVFYGHRAPGADRSRGKTDKKQQGKIRSGLKVAAPRNNFIVQAVEGFQTTFERRLPEVLEKAIKPGYFK